MQLPPQAQQLLLQLQTFQQQINSVAMQKENMNIQKIETDKALEELQKAKENEEIYKAVGPILVRSSKSNMKKELEERKEMIDLRLKSLEKQDDKLRNKIKENQEKLQEFLKGIGSIAE